MGSNLEKIPNIKRVVPIDFYELIIQFDNLEYRLFPAQKVKLNEKYAFLSYPNKLRSLKYESDKIVWANNISLDKEFIYRQSEHLSIHDLRHKYTTVNFKNQAPTDEDSRHHEYSFSIRPFDHEKTFNLTESIGGGHGERGGSLTFSLEELLHYKNWKNHIEKSNCAWIIEIIEQNKQDIEKIIDLSIQRFANEVSLVKSQAPRLQQYKHLAPPK